MLRELISRFTTPTHSPVLSQTSQQSQSQFQKKGLLYPARVAKVATVAVAIVENRKPEVPDQASVANEGASAPVSGTGLDWSPWPVVDDDPNFTRTLCPLPRSYSTRPDPTCPSTWTTCRFCLRQRLWRPSRRSCASTRAFGFAGPRMEACGRSTPASGPPGSG